MNKIFYTLIMIIAFGLSNQLTFATGILKTNSSETNTMSIEFMQFEISDEVFSEVIEDWMVDVTHWDIMADIGDEMYSMTEIEKWMQDVDRWSLPNELLAEEFETIEYWMKDPCHWNFSGIEYCESIPENNHQLQDWMINPYYFQI